MYGRGVRLLTQPALSTAPGVGPGTYRVDDGTKHAGESYAPFCSMAVRKSFLTVDQQLATAPGPSHYTPDLEDHVKGGDSLKSKAERFRDRLSRTPGPGTYSVSKRSDWLRKTYPPPSPGDQLFQSTGMIKSGRLLFTRKQTAPSIPTPGQSYGYDETGDGDLTPQPLPPQDSTMGPAYYNVSHDDTVTTKKYRGVHFGNQNSLRTQFKGREGPGPGDYHQPTEDSADVSPPSHPPPQTKATSSKSLPRYHMIITRQEEKKAVPGPGRYDIRSQFRTDPSADGTGQNEDEREEETEDAPFGSREKRFIDPKHHSPSCTTYQEPRSAFSRGRLGHGKAPFGQTSLRFRRNRRDREIPGPGMYNNNHMTSLVVDLSRRSHTSVRTAPLIKKDVILGPGPAHYQPSESQSVEPGDGGRSQQPRETKPSYTFASTTSRLYSPPSIVTVRTYAPPTAVQLYIVACSRVSIQVYNNFLTPFRYKYLPHH
ncbi:Sperm-tail PG-rich repeat-containing protein 2, partial [Geodia barretti]